MQKTFIALLAIIGCAGMMVAQQRPLSPEIKCEWELPSDPGTAPSVTLTITMPVKFDGYYNDNYEFVEGAALDKIDRFELTRNSYESGEEEHLIYYIENPTPGETYVYRDTEPIAWGTSYNWSGKVIYDLNDSDNTSSYPQYVGQYIGIRPADAVVKAFSDRGAAPFGLDITLPTTDSSKGELIGGLSKVIISRAEGWNEREAVAEITEGIQPGASIRWIDSDLVPAEDVTYNYYVSVAGPYGKSGETSVALKLGRAYNPSNITDINSVINDDNTVSLTWKMDEIGFDGGYVPVEDLRFTVKRMWRENPSDWQFAEKVLVENLTEMAYSDNIEDITDVKTVHYEIIAKYVDSEGASSGTSSDIVLGPSYTLPFAESFFYLPEGAYYPVAEKQWMSEGNVTVNRYVSYTNAAGEYINLQSRHDTPENNTDTWLYFFDAYSDNGISAQYKSHRIDLKDVTNPVLTLWRHARSGQAGRVEVFVDLPGDDVTFKAGEISFYDSADIKDGWTEVVMPLNIPAGNDWMALRLVAHTPGIDEDFTSSALCIDDIMIADYPVPSNLTAEIGDDLHASLSWDIPEVDNMTLSAFEVLRNDVKIAELTATDATFTDAVAIRPRKVTKYTVKAIYDGKISASSDIETFTDNFIEDDFRYYLDENEETASVVKYLGSDGEIVIPQEARDYTVVAINSRAFAGDETIHTVAFPSSVSEIGEEAFYGCKMLNKVIFTSIAPPVVGNGAFEGIAEGAEGVCPSESYDAYTSVENLRTLNFSGNSGISEVSYDMIDEIEYFSIDGKRLDTPVDRGLVIRRILLKDGSVIVEKVLK